MDTFFYIAVLIMSVVIHEVSHGFVAEYFGDKTARYAGRLTLNPIPHLDFFGSILLPAILILAHSPFLLGWAKPVPYNPNNLSNRRWGELAVAASGIIANFFIVLIFGILIRFAGALSLPVEFYAITSIIVVVNLMLGIFNLVPIPPLDGSKILFALLPASWNGILAALEQYAFITLLLFIFYLAPYLHVALGFMYKLFTGMDLAF